MILDDDRLTLPIARDLCDHDMWWNPDADGARLRRKPPRCVVLHTTGGEGSAQTTYRTLRKRGLSVHFVVDRDGVCWQMADPMDTTALHAGHANARSVGIEVTNYLHRRGRPLDPERPRYRDDIHGHTLTLARCYSAQHAAVLALVDTLCQQIEIPRHLPRGSAGQLYTDVMPRAVVRRFEGVMGHFHVDPGKIDPGLDLFRTLEAAGYA